MEPLLFSSVRESDAVVNGWKYCSLNSADSIDEAIVLVLWYDPRFGASFTSAYVLLRQIHPEDTPLYRLVYKSVTFLVFLSLALFNHNPNILPLHPPYPPPDLAPRPVTTSCFFVNFKKCFSEKNRNFRSEDEIIIVDL